MGDTTPNHNLPGWDATDTLATTSLAKQWAKKYLQKLIDPDDIWDASSKGTRSVSGDAEGRSLTAQRLLQSIRGTNLQAWTKTETLLSKEVRRHGIDYKLIDPYAIAQDVYHVYEKALSAYAEQLTPQRLCIFIASDIGSIREKYTSVDARVIGFVSMQFHYCGQLLLESVSPQEQTILGSYFKVIDDHLYIPLHRFYDIAAQYDYDSPVLESIRELLPPSSEIARKTAMRMLELYPNYHCYSGSLSDPTVMISSIRDVEMFQVYLWICVLERSVAAIQQELFPLCVMLYPPLKVQWELVRQMLHSIGVELQNRLRPQQRSLFMPYFQSLWDLFSPEVFPETLEDDNSNKSA
jgi:hypothetical protein